jgi:hypothetical protein
MKKVLFLIVVLISFSFIASAQKFVYGTLHVSGNCVVKGSISAPSILNDSIGVGSQYIKYASGDSLADFSWVRTYADAHINGKVTTGLDTLNSDAGPGAAQDGYMLGWDNSNDQYLLINPLTIGYYTGSLTDGTPTEAEIVAIIGTAASNGAGFKAVIKDSDGTGLIYTVYTDGTSYYWVAGTLAL